MTRLTGDPASGAALLDKLVPGWHEKVDITKLNIGDRHNDVLGQIYGDYVLGCEALTLTNEYERMRFGFSADCIEDVDRLNERWPALVRERQAA